MESKIEGAVTREKVRALADDMASDSATVEEVVHDGFNADRENGGYAFLFDNALLTFSVRKGYSHAIDPGNRERRLDHIEEFWRSTQHRNRTLEISEVSELHRAAIRALELGLDRVEQLPPDARVDAGDVGKANYLLVQLRRWSDETSPAREAALRALAAHDWLLGEPDDWQAAHDCPVCGLPATGRPWHYITVCDRCYRKTVCSHGRNVDGHNTSISGGFGAIHTDDSSVCEQVTGDGVVYIESHKCRMGEAKFGGVFVGVEPRSQDA